MNFPSAGGRVPEKQSQTLQAALIIEIINITRAGIEGKIWESIYWGANQRKSNVFLQKRPLNYGINNENTNTFINVYLQKKTQ